MVPRAPLLPSPEGCNTLQDSSDREQGDKYTLAMCKRQARMVEAADFMSANLQSIAEKITQQMLGIASMNQSCSKFYCPKATN